VHEVGTEHGKDEREPRDHGQSEENLGFPGECHGQREHQDAGGHEGVAVEAVCDAPGFLVCEGPGGPDTGVRIGLELG